MHNISKFKWFIGKLIINLLLVISQLIIKRDKDIFLFGAKLDNKNEIFANSSKYLFLYLQEKHIKSFWLKDDKNFTVNNSNLNINFVNRYSLKGLYLILKAKYWFTDFSANQVSFFNGKLSKIKCINLWHGIPLKKLGYDDKQCQLNYKKNNLQNKIYELLKSKTDFWIVNNQYDGNCRKTAFDATDEQIKILGAPRLDVLYKDITGADLFMEEDFNYIKFLKAQGKRLIIYMPTWRDTGKDISGWLKSDKLKQFLKNTNSTLICKLHPYDNNSLDFEISEEIYKMANDSDVYPILKYTDSLITDYSSVYFDYLLLDRPIIYYPIDLEEYQEKCRGFYRPYEELTAGVKAYNEDELISAMQDVINGVDNYKEERKVLRDKMFKYQDGKNCERVVEWIKSLNEKGK